MKKTRKEKRRSNFAFRIIYDAVLLHSSKPQKKNEKKENVDKRQEREKK